jgi:hypothetical protein
MLLSSPLLLFFVHFTSVLAFLCLSSLYLFFYFSCSLCLSLFLFLLVSLCIICVSSFFVCVFLYYLFMVLSFFVAFVCSSWFLWVCICWLDQQPTVRGSWSSLLLEEGHKSLCLLYVSVFFWVDPGQPGSTHLTRDPITWPDRWPGWVSKLCNWVLLSFDVRSREFL